MSIRLGAKTALHLASEGRFSTLLRKIGHRLHEGWYQEDVSYGLRRDLQAPFTAPAAKAPIYVRQIRPEDIETLCDGWRDDPELAWRRELLEKDLRTCYVAVDERTGAPCYMQWLMSSDQNWQIQTIGAFPKLKPDEALLENAYTPASHRGLGIMPAAMALIAAKAADFGARYVITFVHRDNVPSLKGCEKAGFSTYCIPRRSDAFFGVIRRLRFEATLAEAI
ncbi:MAG TPA: GNAT family N-acetyltransferase [Beijerinckiaceae bacterium]|nr:GNAT family N-acetyltransferase [Beijerinckiaceae bacterium]